MKPSRLAPDDPLEVKLAFEVKECRTCKFFWPVKGAPTYGPYPTYDFTQDFPKQAKPTAKSAFSDPWVTGVTNRPGFPEPEVIDGCRKAPIMTIGINPNLTAALPETTGAAWAYPLFADTAKSDGVTKYAWYYRYRTVDQEHFAPAFIEKYLLTQGQITATADGRVARILETSEAPHIALDVAYEGGKTQTFNLTWAPGTPRYVVLTNTFKKGDVIAARLQVPGGKGATVYHQQQSYYERIVPVLNDFSAFLRARGHAVADLKVGEDVCQLDMVACASPHWGPDWLGGTTKSAATIVHNCVTLNHWAVKQLIQTQPALLILVGQPSYEMFAAAFGKWIKTSRPLPANPVDGAFTLLRQTADPKTPVFVEFSYSAGGQQYTLKTRLVVSPHFSYSSNFYPQFRLSPSQLRSFSKTFAGCVDLLKQSANVTYAPPPGKEDYVAFELVKNAKATFAALKRKFPEALKALMPAYVAANTTLYDVMADMYTQKALSWTAGKKGGYLSRNAGSCHFCVNQHWEFPPGCPYGKVTETPPPPGFLEAAAQAFVRGGK